MTDRRNALTPEALAMMDAIARTGSFAAAARELGRVPSALTYQVRQLEEALDALLFDRRSRQARLTPAGEELLEEGRRVLAELDAVTNRVHRVASGWETRLTIAYDAMVSRPTLFDLAEAFYALRPNGVARANGSELGPGTRLRLRTEVLAGTWEALTNGQADLAVGATAGNEPPTGVQVEPMGDVAFVFAVAPRHPLAAHKSAVSDHELAMHRAVAIADSALRLSPITVNLLPGQDVLTVPSLQAKAEAQLRGLGCGFLPEPLARSLIASGHLVAVRLQRPCPRARLCYAWRATSRRAGGGLALKWWLDRLKSPATRRALLERHDPSWPSSVD
ncbi:MAG TPA: LysR family transcriptional regulator [Burkholderiaceae bacterium]|jgi:DNA-binding transcriptional LysR family regulator|nr:LysR family transcriptional regulator [Burkholderiaceae bacterium]